MINVSVSVRISESHRFNEKHDIASLSRKKADVSHWLSAPQCLDEFHPLSSFLSCLSFKRESILLIKQLIPVCLSPNLSPSSPLQPASQLPLSWCNCWHLAHSGVQLWHPSPFPLKPPWLHSFYKISLCLVQVQCSAWQAAQWARSWAAGLWVVCFQCQCDIEQSFPTETKSESYAFSLGFFFAAGVTLPCWMCVNEWPLKIIIEKWVLEQV